ncbi:MAG: MATE family efflux transporter, partial [Rubrobacteraceae bacterium]
MKSRAASSGRRYDREIFALAFPALGALAAEPTYILVDTAIVGHLGTPQLAALAIAGTLLATGITVFNFLTYGTTARVARLYGAGETVAAGRLGSQALWLAVGLGIVVFMLALLLAVPAVAVMGGEGQTAE